METKGMRGWGVGGQLHQALDGTEKDPLGIGQCRAWVCDLVGACLLLFFGEMWGLRLRCAEEKASLFGLRDNCWGGKGGGG